MGKTEKLLDKLCHQQSALTWRELNTLLTALGYKRIEGKGSRVKFVKGHCSIDLHKPHPGNEVKHYVKRLVLNHLVSRGDIE